MYTLEGKVVVVVGGGRGLGRATARRFAEKGANLVLVARTEQELNEAAEEVRQLGVKVLVVPADASLEEDVARIGTEARNAFSDVDIVINCAAQGFSKNLADTTVDEWERTIAANLKLAFLVTREFLPPMMERGSGQIINISSRFSLEAFGAATTSIYGSAKAGITFFSHAQAMEAKKHGVKVLAIAPGPMDTPLRRKFHPDFPREQALSPEVMADFIVWITSYPEFTFEDRVIPVSLYYG